MLNRIARVRRQKGFTRREMAEKLHISPERLAEWETGEDRPTLDELHHLCDALQVQPEDLYHRPDLLFRMDVEW